MQPGTSQQGDTPPSGTRSSSFNLFLKKAFAKRGKTSDSTPATPEGQSSTGAAAAGSGTGTQRTPKPQRSCLLTDVDLNNNVTALQTALTEAWPRRHHSRYKSVRALLVCWADDVCTSRSSTAAPFTSRIPSVAGSSTLGLMRMSGGTNRITPYRATATHGPVRMSSSPSMRQDANQGPFTTAARLLASVLERRYGIQSQVWMIPSLDNPQDMLLGKIKLFVDNYGGPDNLLVFWYGGNAEFISTMPAEGGAPGGGAAITGELTWYGLYVSSLSFCLSPSPLVLSDGWDYDQP
ncbi:hypothetical protein F5Y14DRAFT_147857 [Nemania sp. NC0429]|nr:hypothetical protein F5Y14DRAFT_147857 [Nemania sp. NC0429]